jgi:2-methylcitrate dehydratase PrpD
MRWEISRNGHKPHACGVVLHAAIDAMIRIRGDHRIEPERVVSVELRVHPLVLAITGVVAPETGLQSKFSIYHSAAVALIDGRCGVAQFNDERARDPLVVSTRGKVRAVADETLRRDQAFARVVTPEGSFDRMVEHAAGTIDNPMTDAALEEKFLANSSAAIGEDRARRVLEFAWSLEKQPDVTGLVRLCA